MDTFGGAVHDPLAVNACERLRAAFIYVVSGLLAMDYSFQNTTQ